MPKRKHEDTESGSDQPTKTKQLKAEEELKQKSPQKGEPKQKSPQKGEPKQKSPQKGKEATKSKPTEAMTAQQLTTVISTKFVLFYSSKNVFSQFHPAKFIVDGLQYNCMEQYMHHQKAVMFNDKIRAQEILKTSDPKTQKKLGRQVQNFDKAVWGAKSRDVVKKGSEQKYLQNEEMKKILFDTYPKTLVEAAPRDRLWGIGLGAKNPKAQDPGKWRGKNWLGYCLTTVRDKLMEQEGHSVDRPIDSYFK